MIQLTEEKLQDVLKYLEGDLPNCLYLYGDVVRYGLHDPNIKVWYSEKDGKLNAVVMRYFTGCHVFSKDLDYNYDELLAKLREINVDRISGQRPVIEALQKDMGAQYGTDFGCVFKLNSYRKIKSPVVIERATAADADAIAEFLMTSEVYSESYRKEALAAELADRIEREIGRSYIIRDGERIVAHDSVTLETNTYAIAGLALVHDDFRNTLYGSFLDSYMINDLREEGKELYCMIVEGRRLDAFIKLGNKVCANYGKLFR